MKILNYVSFNIKIIMIKYNYYFIPLHHEIFEYSKNFIELNHSFVYL